VIYLYLGQRRGHRIYLENRFVNLIWGVETFHRVKHPEHPTASKLKERSERILAKFTKEDLENKTTKVDIKWLAGKLKHSEPSLEDRIFETITSLPLGLKQKAIRHFARSCADRRNDISHYGGQRQKGKNNDFIMDLAKKSDALEYLYHALLLQELQLEEQIVKNYIYDSYKSFRIKHALVEVGLLDKGILKPPAMPVPPMPVPPMPVPP
jgi:ApeA N-terminal domain 1